MRFGIPKYRLPRDVLDAEVRAHRRSGRRDRSSTPRSPTSAASMRSGRFDAAFLAVGAHIAKTRLHPGGRGRANSRRGVGAAQHGRRGEAAARPPRRRLRRRQHRARRRAHRQAPGRDESIIVYRRTREKMPAHDFEVEEALQEGVLYQVAVDDQQQAERGHLDRGEDGARRRRAFRSRPASSRRSRPTRWCWRSARTSTSSLLEGVPGS